MRAVVNMQTGTVTQVEDDTVRDPAADLAEWRTRASARLLDMQDWLLDNGLWDAAEAIGTDPKTPKKWRIRWGSPALTVRRKDPKLIEACAQLLASVEDPTPVDDWLDGLPIWTPARP